MFEIKMYFIIKNNILISIIYNKVAVYSYN